MPKIKVRVQAVIFNKDKELLLALHKKNNKSYWVLPGGGVEFCEKLDKAIIRELKEELGFTEIEVKDLVFLDEYIANNESRHVVLIAFLVDVPEKLLENISIVAKEESIKSAGFFSTKTIVESKDTFYPSKKILSQLFEIL